MSGYKPSNTSVQGPMTSEAGFEASTKTTIAGTSASNSTATASSNTRVGQITITMDTGHTWSAGSNSMTVSFTNTAIDTDSVVIASSTMVGTVFSPNTIANNSCRFSASSNGSGGHITPTNTFVINFLVI